MEPTLVWDRYNGTPCITGAVYKFQVFTTCPPVCVEQLGYIPSDYYTTVSIDEDGVVIDHPPNLTEEQRGQAENAWARFTYIRREQEITIRAQAARAAQEVAAMMQARRMGNFEEEYARYMQQEMTLKAAESKAQVLLTQNLSPRQMAEYRRYQHVIVYGRHNRYRIRHGRTINIDVVDSDGYVTHRLCAYPDGDVPYSDVMLAQKLWLENNENEFLRTAVAHPASNYPRERLLPPL